MSHPWVMFVAGLACTAFWLAVLMLTGSPAGLIIGAGFLCVAVTSLLTSRAHEGLMVRRAYERIWRSQHGTDPPDWL